MADPTAQRRAPRPVAGVPGADAALVAKGWLVALVQAAPLSEAGALPVDALAAEGPALCRALLEALGSDAALDALRPGGDRAALAVRAGILAGASSPAAAVAAIEALRHAAWEALATDDAQLAVRLAHVCGVLLESALTAPPDERPATPPIGATPGRSVPGEEPVIVVHDARESGSDAEPWRSPIERRLERQTQDGRPFAVLAVEVDDLDRLLVSATGREVVEAIESAERAICGALRPADMLVRERLGRYWLTAPETDVQAGRALGERLAEAVSTAAFHHGAPLGVSIGVAVSPDDALDPATLAAHADEGLFAARAAGVPLA